MASLALQRPWLHFGHASAYLLFHAHCTGPTCLSGGELTQKPDTLQAAREIVTQLLPLWRCCGERLVEAESSRRWVNVPAENKIRVYYNCSYYGGGQS